MSFIDDIKSMPEKIKKNSIIHCNESMFQKLFNGKGEKDDIIHGIKVIKNNDIPDNAIVIKRRSVNNSMLQDT